MAAPSEFVEFLTEQLEPLGGLSLRAMFGGHGCYLDGLFFAILFDDELYLKTDLESRSRFEEAGAHPFSYSDRHGRETVLSYYSVPEGALEDATALLAWVREACSAALRARSRKKPRRRR